MKSPPQRRNQVSAELSHWDLTRQSSAPKESINFSLVLGGPLYQLLCRVHLCGSALELIRRRVVALSLFAWLPLLALSGLNGNLMPGISDLPFIMDVEVHVRFLLAMPLLIVAEIVVHRRMRSLLRQFLERKLIGEGTKARFDAAVASAFRLRDSLWTELLLIACVYGMGFWMASILPPPLFTSSWHTVPAWTGSELSLAGWWYAYVSLPLFQFLLMRWFFRIFIWARFLWQVSRIELNLAPTHPDRVGGLGFLADTAYALVPLALAQGAVVSARIANRIFHLNAALTEFKVEIAVVVIFVQLLVMTPLLTLAAQLASAKRIGLREYGTLAAHYIHEFDARWLHGLPASESLTRNTDIRVLADLGRSFEMIRNMRVAPVTRDAVFQLAIATLIPIAPLVLTLLPLEVLSRMLADFF